MSLPPTSEVWGKVTLLHLFVIHSVHKGGVLHPGGLRLGVTEFRVDSAFREGLASRGCIQGGSASRRGGLHPEGEVYIGVEGGSVSSGIGQTPHLLILWDEVNEWLVCLLLECILISLYIRSMKETICYARASRKKEGKIYDQIGKNTGFWDLVQNTPPKPQKFKFRQILALWVVTSTEHTLTPTPGKFEI